MRTGAGFGVFVFALACIATDSIGGGFAIPEQSVKELGVALAGAAAAAEDPTTVYYNPAGLACLSGRQLTAGTNLLLPSTRFSNQGSTDFRGQPLDGGDGSNAGSTIPLPYLFFSNRINERFSAGIGIYSPFGLKTRYDQGWVGRYHAIESTLFTLNVNPSFAYRVTDNLTIGGGITAQYIKAKLSNAIDFGSIFAAQGAPGFTPQRNDGFVTFRGDSWSWGYNLGALYEFTGDTRVGIAYRSRIEHTLKGDAEFSGAPSPNPTGRFLNSGVRSNVTLPDSLSLSLWHDFNDSLAAMADVTWTNWSTLDELRIKFDNPAETDAVTTLHWKDTFRYSVGTMFKSGPWTIRTGAAYEKSPVQDVSLRTPRIPDSDRISLAGGAGFKIGNDLSVDVGFMHLFVRDSETRKTATGENRFRGGLSGSYESSINIVSTEFTWLF